MSKTRIIFTHDGKEIPSMSKLLAHLYRTGNGVSKSTMQRKYLRDQDKGTFTHGNIIYDFRTIYYGEKPSIPEKPQKPTPPTDKYGRLIDVTHKVIYELTPTHHLERTLSSKNTLLHTKSISLS